jgi:hypothetical protein
MNNTSSANRASHIEITSNQALSVDVAPGTAIQCVSGRLWLTQEGDARDHCIPAGVTFCADRSGRAVLTAIDGPSIVMVRERAAGYVPGTVTVDSMDRVSRYARTLQAAELAHLLGRAGAWIVAALKAIGRQRRHRRSRIESVC